MPDAKPVGTPLPKPTAKEEDEPKKESKKASLEAVLDDPTLIDELSRGDLEKVTAEFEDKGAAGNVGQRLAARKIALDNEDISDDEEDEDDN